ncbi:MAG: outer membrane beta-barrel protein [Mucilaginibacter sp.]
MKSKKLIIYILSAIAGLLPLSMQGQDKLQLSGKVLDSATQKPLDYITVNLKTDKQTPFKVQLTKNNGAFAFTGLSPLKYTIVFSAVGYQSKTIGVDMVNNTTSNLGSILLNSAGKELKGVVISADKPIIKQEIDRISYDLQADPESKVSSVLEMLRKVPFVSLDANDNILLNGNNSYKILINGKPSGMMERDPINILRSMPASTIQRIEVITTPPAKYDAEGLAGIINIITNKKVDNGYNGTLNINDRYPGGPGIGSSFTYKDGKFGISAFGNGSIYSSPSTSTLTTRTTTGTRPTNLVQQGSGSNNGRSGSIGTELSYEIDSLNLISGQFSINGSKSHSNSYQSSLENGQSGLIQGYDINNASNRHGGGLDASANYQLGFKGDKSKLLTFSYNYYGYNNINDNGLATTNRVGYFTPDYNQHRHTTSSEQTAQIDYVKSFKKWSIEAGAKGIFRNNQSDFEYDSLNTVTNQFLPYAAFSDKFTNTQKIYAVYNTWQYKGKGWGVKAGLRVEQTFTDADFIAATSNLHQHYLNIFPSVAANWDFKDNSGINLGFTQRVKRPSIERLDPFPDKSNPDFITMGNPNLQRVVVNGIQFGYHFTKKASVNIGVTYNYANGLDLPAAVFNQATNITTTTYQNSGNVSGIGANININYPIAKQWNFSLNSNTMYFWLSGPINGIVQNNQFLTLNISTSTGYTFSNGWRANANLDVNGRNPTGLQGSSNGFVGSSFSANKQIIKNKLTFSVAARNPFSQYRTTTLITNGNNFAQTNVNQVYFRSFSASLNYNFGKLKEALKKTRRSINNDDN